MCPRGRSRAGRERYCIGKRARRRLGAYEVIDQHESLRKRGEDVHFSHGFGFFLFLGGFFVCFGGILLKTAIILSYHTLNLYGSPLVANWRGDKWEDWFSYCAKLSGSLRGTHFGRILGDCVVRIWAVQREAEMLFFRGAAEGVVILDKAPAEKSSGDNNYFVKGSTENILPFFTARGLNGYF